MQIVEDQTVLLGPPGTGKTTSIMEMVEEDLRTYAPEQISLVSFTRKAVNEAAERACVKFKYDRFRFPYFQTIHSMCYRQLGCQKNDLMSRADYAELGEILGYTLTASTSVEDGLLIMNDFDKGSKLLFIDNMARVTRRDLKEVWKEANADIMWIEMERFSNVYTKYRQQTGKLDFTDLLDKYIQVGAPLFVKVAYIDEAQDLSRIQWEALAKCFANCEKVIIAGDDDQSIFKWSGADLGSFLKLDGEIKVLGHSYRLPQAIQNKATAIVGRVKQRFDKPFTCAEHTGTVGYVSSFDQIRIKEKESTMILVRNVYLLNRIYESLALQGLSFTGRSGYESINDAHIKAIVSWEMLRKGDAIPLDAVKAVYEQLRVGEILSRGGKAAINAIERQDELFSWETLRDFYGLNALPIWNKALTGIPLEKREYYTSVLRSGKKLSAPTNIHVNTIHGVKGGEADHVIVVSDMSKRTYDEMQRDPDSEHRVAYVAVTRAKKQLTIVLPESRFSYTY